MSSMLSTVSKDYIKPNQIMGLPFIDSDVEVVSVGISSVEEALAVLVDVRGY